MFLWLSSVTDLLFVLLRERFEVLSHVALRWLFIVHLLVQLKHLLEKAGLPERRFHDLRHSAATMLLMMGVHPKVVQEMLGHSEISMTMDTYSHVLPTMQRDAIDKLN